MQFESRWPGSALRTSVNGHEVGRRAQEGLVSVQYGGMKPCYGSTRFDEAPVQIDILKLPPPVGLVSDACLWACHVFVPLRGFVSATLRSKLV